MAGGTLSSFFTLVSDYSTQTWRPHFLDFARLDSKLSLLEAAIHAVHHHDARVRGALVARLSPPLGPTMMHAQQQQLLPPQSPPSSSSMTRTMSTDSFTSTTSSVSTVSSTSSAAAATSNGVLGDFSSSTTSTISTSTSTSSNGGGRSVHHTATQHSQSHSLTRVADAQHHATREWSQDFVANHHFRSRSPPSRVMGSRYHPEIERLRQEFFDVVDSEIERLNAFSAVAEAVFQERIRLLESRLNDLTRRLGSLSAKSSRHSTPTTASTATTAAPAASSTAPVPAAPSTAAPLSTPPARPSPLSVSSPPSAHRRSSSQSLPATPRCGGSASSSLDTSGANPPQPFLDASAPSVPSPSNAKRTSASSLASAITPRSSHSGSDSGSTTSTLRRTPSGKKHSLQAAASYTNLSLALANFNKANERAEADQDSSHRRQRSNSDQFGSTPNFKHFDVGDICEDAVSSPLTNAEKRSALDALALRIRFDVLVCGRGLLNLEEYSNINLTGFEQLFNRFQMIINEPAEPFIQSVEQAPFYERAPYEHLCVRLEKMNLKLLKVLRPMPRYQAQAAAVRPTSSSASTTAAVAAAAVRKSMSGNRLSKLALGGGVGAGMPVAVRRSSSSTSLSTAQNAPKADRQEQSAAAAAASSSSETSPKAPTPMENGATKSPPASNTSASSRDEASCVSPPPIDPNAAPIRPSSSSSSIGKLSTPASSTTHPSTPRKKFTSSILAGGPPPPRTPRRAHTLSKQSNVSSVESFISTFVSCADESSIPTDKRRRMEFWRQCRRLNGIEFPMPNIGGDAAGGDANGFGADAPMTFSRRVGGQVSVPMHMHPLTDPLAQQAAHYQAYADRSDPYAFGYGAASALNSHNPPPSQRHSQQQQQQSDGGHARNGNRQNHERRNGDRGQAAAAPAATAGKPRTFIQRIVESISKRWLTNRPLVIGIGFLMLITVLTLWSTASASPTVPSSASSLVSDASADMSGVADAPLLSSGEETHLAAKTLELVHDDVGHDDGI